MNKVIIPKEYTQEGNMKEYSIDDFIQTKVQNAVKRALERNESYQMPQWFYDMYKRQGLSDERIKYKWQGCISTALNSYGYDDPITGNPTFREKHKDVGFDLVHHQKYDGTEYKDWYKSIKLGDIVQLGNYRDDGSFSPHHSVLVTGFDDDGNPVVSYDDGRNWYKKNIPLYKIGYDGYNLYRYAGTDNELNQIKQHNENVLNQRKSQNIPVSAQKEDMSVQPTNAKDETIKFLDKFIK